MQSSFSACITPVNSELSDCPYLATDTSYNMILNYCDISEIPRVLRVILNNQVYVLSLYLS